ncbi:hypothetical protein Mapa_008807 [Marchantia paleacea]|nr:hypothetical protein Mapa_008807 [Marchantia paleacea]
MMVDVLDRRVTRSLSSELQARAAQSGSYLRHDVSSYSPQQQNHLNHLGYHEAADSSLHYGISGSNHIHVGTPYMRNTSEEIYLSTLMDPSNGMIASSSGVEGLNFLDPLQPSNAAQTHRGNSEELFHHWISNTTTTTMETANVGSTYGDSPGGHRSRRRVSSELQAILAQQNGSNLYARSDHVDQASLQTNSFLAEDMVVCDDNQRHRGNLSKETGGPPDYSPSSPLKNMPWFNTNSPMTRSRSSELQRRYAQMEGLPFPPTAEALQKLVVQSSLEVNPTVATLGAFARNNGSPPQTSASPPMPPTTVAHTQLLQPPMESQSNNHISAAISMLKGSLERKKLSSKQQQHTHHLLPISQGGTRPDASLHMASLPVDPTVAKQQRHNESGHSPPLGQQPNMMLNAHSPSESSGGAPAHSAGMTTSDGPSNSGMSAHRQALKRGNLSSVDQPSPRRHHSGFDVPSPSSNAQSNGDMYESGTVSKTETRKKGGEHLTRAGSITSSIRSGFQVSDIDEATKKRRVERQRKMQEAKGRGSAPPMPADVQAAVKRCEALEKEVRSLKLNLAFMNRKDSEQTKRIEELEKQNEELHEEKDKLLEELERFSTMNDPGGSTP